jgi:hypothetical protein
MTGSAKQSISPRRKYGSLRRATPRKTVILRESGVSSTLRLLDSIIGRLGILDRPPEPVIGRRYAPTRWRAMTAESVARADGQNGAIDPTPTLRTDDLQNYAD